MSRQGLFNPLTTQTHQKTNFIQQIPVNSNHQTNFNQKPFFNQPNFNKQTPNHQQTANKLTASSSFSNNLLPQTNFRKQEKVTAISLQPSITFNSFSPQLQQPHQYSHLTNQQLPTKAAGDFHKIPSTHFPTTFQQVPTIAVPQQAFNNYQPFNQQRHRFNRQESGTANLGINAPVFQHQTNFQQNRFFRSNYNGIGNQPVVSHQLNSLLQQSGVANGGTQEDLSIISKVLSLNHYS